MKNTFGAQIRALRKQAGITQEQLASGIITKSMLSQIENGNAAPSLKTLTQLAGRLGVPVSQFMAAEGQPSPDSALGDVFFRRICDELASVDAISANDREGARPLLDQIVQEIGLNTQVLSSAELLRKAGSCYLDISDFEAANTCFAACRRLYETNKLFVQAAQAHLETRHLYMDRYDVAGSFAVLDEAQAIYAQAPNPDISFEVELLYYRACFALAFNAGPISAIQSLSQALELSSKGNLIYYDELLRIKAQIFLDSGNFQEFDQCIQDALLFSKVSHSPIYPRIIAMQIAGENKKGNGKQALELLAQHQQLLTSDDTMPVNRQRNLRLFLAAEAATAYYLEKDFAQALRVLDDVDLLGYHRYLQYGPDLAFWCERKALYGQILTASGSREAGIDIIRQALAKLQELGAFREQAATYERLSSVYESIGCYQESLDYLRKASQLFKCPLYH